jgi:hypothetical protein
LRCGVAPKVRSRTEKKTCASSFRASNDNIYEVEVWFVRATTTIQTREISIHVNAARPLLPIAIRPERRPNFQLAPKRAVVRALKLWSPCDDADKIGLEGAGKDF